MEFWFRYLDSALCKAPLGDASQFSSSGGIIDGTSLANAWWPALVGEQGLRRAGRPRRHPAFLSITKGRLFIVNVTAELSSQLDAEAEPLDSGSDHDDRGRGRGGAAAPTVNLKWSSSSDALAPAQPKSKSHASLHRSKSPTLVLPVPNTCHRCTNRRAAMTSEVRPPPLRARARVRVQARVQVQVLQPTARQSANGRSLARTFGCSLRRQVRCHGGFSLVLDATTLMYCLQVLSKHLRSTLTS